MPETGDELTGLATLNELKARMNVRPDGNIDEDVLKQVLESASERVIDLTGRRFTPHPTIPEGETEDDVDPVTFTASAFNSKFCQAFDVRNVEVITADGVDVTATCRLIRSNPEWPAHGIRLANVADQVSITGYFGFANIPPSIRDAVLGWAHRAYMETRARMADTSVDPETGIQSYFRTVPPFVSGPVNTFKTPGL